MKTFLRLAFSIGAVSLLLVGCGGSQTPTAVANPLPQARTIAMQAARGKSWIMPEAKSENLLYVTDVGVGVIVYSYRPSPIKYVGLLAEPQYGQGECVDKAQNIFITDFSVVGSSGIFEYAHGGTTPIAILGNSYYIPDNCSVDPTTGNLAAVGYPYQGVSDGVTIYKKARGRPTFYAAGFAAYDCGYDDKGNLFIDGGAVSGHLSFAELPKGSTTFRNITLSQSFHAPGGIQWDGKHLAVGDSTGAAIYQFDVRGSRGREVGSTPLNGAGDVSQFFIEGDRVIAPSSFGDDYTGFVGIYAYPAGGPPTKTRINADDPDGAAVSVGLK